jgi:hypothetical protein
MTRANFKNSVIALAIGLVMVSCGGRNSNAQGQQTTTATAQSSTEVAGSMDALSAGDIPQSWTDGLAAKTGIKSLGKPKGTTEVEASDWEGGFTVYFFCDNTEDAFIPYTKAVWDLNKSVAEKGELLLRKYEDGAWTYKPVNSLADARDDEYSYIWFYSFGGEIWRITARVNTVGSDKGSIQLTIEKR